MDRKFYKNVFRQRRYSFFDENSDASPLVNTYYPFNEPFYLILNVASGGNFDSSFQTDTNSFCHNADCTNLLYQIEEDF